MVSSSRLESLAQRFHLYIDELQDLFRARKIPFGSTADLAAFPGRLADPAFADEMASMVRSVFYRENEALPLVELSDMVALAAGGTHWDEVSPEVHATLQEVRAFVTTVARPQRSFLTEVPAINEFTPTSSSATAASLAASVEPLNMSVADLEPATPSAAAEALPPHLPAARPSLATPEAAAAGQPERVAAETTDFPTNDRLSRALAHTEEQRSPALVNLSTDSDNTASHTFTPTRTQSHRPRQSFGGFLRNAYWIPGLCVLLFALGAIFFMRSKPSPRLPEAPVQAAALPGPTVPKPSAYGPPLRKAAPVRAHTAPNEAGSDTPPDSRVEDTAPALGAAPTPAATRPSSRRSFTHPVAPAKPATVLLPGMREGVFLASSGTMAAHLLSAPAPSYPKLASFARVEGEVIVQVVVSRDGSVSATRVLQGPRLLRGAAEHAIRRWRYRPYVVDGKATDVATIVTVNFQLRH